MGIAYDVGEDGDEDGCHSRSVAALSLFDISA